MIKVMTPYRKIVNVPAEVFEHIKACFHLVQAKDGLWLPSCDLVQYELGRREAA